MEREKLAISAEVAREAIWGEIEGFEKIFDDVVDDTGRWTTTHEIVIKRLSDGKFFRDYYTQGATEHQDQSPWEYGQPEFTEVFPVEKTVIVYE